MKLALPDEDVVRLYVQTGEPLYFETLYRRHYSTIHRVCRGFSVHSAEAQDLTQELFIRLLSRLHTFDGRSRFSTWLNAVARNFCLDYIRRRNARPILYCDALTLPHPAHLDDADDEGATNLSWLEAALCRLSQDDAQLLTHHYQNRTPLRTLAHQRSLSESAIKMRLLRARARLRDAYWQQAQEGQRSTGQMPWLPALSPPPPTYPAQCAGDAGT